MLQAVLYGLPRELFDRWLDMPANIACAGAVHHVARHQATSTMKVTAIQRSDIGSMLKQPAIDAHREIVLPAQYQKDHELDPARNPKVLWSVASHAESGYGNPVIGRRLTAPLPRGLNGKQQVNLARQFAEMLSDRYQTAIDFTVAESVDRDGKSGPYVSFAATTRVMTSAGFAQKTALERRDSSYDFGVRSEAASEIQNIWLDMSHAAVLRQRAVQNYRQRQETFSQSGTGRNAGKSTGFDGADSNSR